MNLDDARSQLARAVRDEGVADALGSGTLQTPDWELVVRFYAALHLVDAYLATKADRFFAERHELRLRAIRESPELRKNPAFERAYRELQEVSEQVRYDPRFVAATAQLENARRNHALVRSILQPKIDRKLH